MKIRRRLRFLLRILIPISYFGALVSVLMTSAALKIDMEWLTSHFPGLEDLAKFLRGIAFIVLPVATVVVAVTAEVRRAVRSTAREKVVKALLDDFLKEGFEDEDASTTHRVTLFKHTRFVLSPLCWIFGKNQCGGWLVPYERAGEFSLGTGVKFYAPKDSPEKFEGVVGYIFGTGNCECIEGLPDLENNVSQSKIDKYVKATRVPAEYVAKRLKKKKTMPRSFWGIPIEIDGCRWGVLLVDSFENSIPNSDRLRIIFRQQAACYNAILESRKK